MGSGTPGFLASVCCRASNDGVGGGADLATTGRVTIAAAGRGALAKKDAGRPSTLAAWGVTLGAGETAAMDLIWFGSIRIAACRTGRAATSALCGTAVRAAGRLWYMYADAGTLPERA